MIETWVVEPEVFSEQYQSFIATLKSLGRNLIYWKDEWWIDGRWPTLTDRPVVFHGSLGNASRIRIELPWSPGAYCNIEAFYCSKWYPFSCDWLAQQKWHILPANQLVNDADEQLRIIGSPERFFVRPDSPLKPFSGRVLNREELSLEALDYGFYYDDPAIQVVIAPEVRIMREWRYIVIDKHIVAGSGYEAAGRTSLSEASTDSTWQFAGEVAQAIPSPERVYVLDICEIDGKYHLLEINPFSGADLYASESISIIRAVSEVVCEDYYLNKESWKQ
jgi:hypothetical protein